MKKVKILSKEISVDCGHNDEGKKYIPVEKGERYVVIKVKDIDNKTGEGTSVRYSTQSQENQENVGKKQSSDDTLILYVTADSSVAQEIINQRKLSPEMASELYVQTMKMWYGSRKEYDDSLVKKEFDRTETTDDFAKAYHYYVMRFSLKNTYGGGKIGNNSGRVDFFINVCQETPKLEQISRRLCFDDNFLTDAYDK